MSVLHCHVILKVNKGSDMESLCISNGNVQNIIYINCMKTVYLMPLYRNTDPVN